MIISSVKLERHIQNKRVTLSIKCQQFSIQMASGFIFFSDEGNEPCHIHVKKGGGRGKIWLLPEVKESYYYGFTEQEKRKIRGIIKVHNELIIEKWNEYFK